MSNYVRNQEEYRTFDSLIAHIKEIPIESVLEPLGIKLQKIGNNFHGNCPTGHHSESGTCFHVNSKENLYFCFSCEIGGDIISLVEEVKGLSFKESLTWIVDQYNIKHSLNLYSYKNAQLSDEDKIKLKRLITNSIYFNKAFEWMHELLFQEEGKEALDYLVNERKYDLETLKNSDFCYFPKVGEIKKYLRSQFPDKTELINQLPLNGYFKDNFRLAFPYRDGRGRITGFLKRATESKGFTLTIKGKVHENVRWDSTFGTQKKDLFNFHDAKSEKTILIVEGYPDAIYFKALGMKNITAVGQGRLSKNHSEGLINSKVESVIISFDNDKVGPNNTRDAVKLISFNSSIAPYVLDPALLSPHKDPDEYAKANGMEAFRQLLKKIDKGLVWLSKQLIIDCDMDNELSKDTIRKELIEYAARTENDIISNDIAGLIMQHFKIDKPLVKNLINQQKDKLILESYEKTRGGVGEKRFLPFIEKSTSTYSYYDSKEDEVYLGVSKDALYNILLSSNQILPDVLPVLKADFYIKMNERYDLYAEKFNFFVPTKYMLLEKNSAVITPEVMFPTITKLLTNLVPNSDEWKRLINWFAGILQTRQKQQTAWVFKGKPGAGKGILLQHVLKPLFGHKLAIKVEDEQLKAPFNPWLQNALLIAFNEVAHDNDTRNSINSKVKAIITDSEVIINEKNIRNFTISNYVNCLFFSNEEVPVFIEQDDRRFNVVTTGGNLREKEWFSDPDKFIHDLEKEVPHFAQYLMNWDYDKIAAMTCINNEEKKKMVDAGMNRFEEFAYHLKRADVSWFEDNISSATLFSKLDANYLMIGKIKKDLAVKIFCDIYNGFDVTTSTLTKKLNNYGIKQTRDRVGGKDDPIYSWNPSMSIGIVRKNNGNSNDLKME